MQYSALYYSAVQCSAVQCSAPTCFLKSWADVQRLDQQELEQVMHDSEGGGSGGKTPALPVEGHCGRGGAGAARHGGEPGVRVGPAKPGED